MDYRALNAITIRYHFSVPTIDELLDELIGTMGFEKRDMESMYPRLFPFSLADKAKEWLKSYPNHNLNSWNDFEEKSLNRNFPFSHFIKSKYDIYVRIYGLKQKGGELFMKFF